jgi:hypothetical protein
LYSHVVVTVGVPNPKAHAERTATEPPGGTVNFRATVSTAHVLPHEPPSIPHAPPPALAVASMIKCSRLAANGQLKGEARGAARERPAAGNLPAHVCEPDRVLA